MELGDALRQRAAELSAMQAQLPGRIRAIARGATLRAVEKATEHTPPNGDEKERGTGMITGELAQHWADDSQVDPIISGDEYRTVLANNVQYASYINDGHKLFPHFVPGLVINPETDLLERVEPTYTDDKGKKHVIGMMVGTKTQEIEGLYMSDKGIDKYREVVRSENKKLIREVFGE